MRILLLLSILLISCGVPKKNEPHQENTTSVDENALVFVLLKINRDSIQQKNTIELISKTIASGKMKDGFQNQSKSENYLTIDQYAQGKLVKTFTIQHPLFKQVEYSDGNNLTSKTIELDSANFFIRLQLSGSSNKIKISETLKDTPTRELTTLKL